MRGALADGGAIRQRRKTLGLTQEQLASQASCDTKTVRRAEQGKNLDTYTLAKIATALAISFVDVIQQTQLLDASQQRNILVVEQLAAAFNERNVDGVMKLCHEDIVMYAPGSPDLRFGGVFRGRNEVRRMHEIAFAAAVTEQLTPANVSYIAVEDYVIARGTAAMKGIGNNRKQKFAFTHMIRIKNDKVIEFSAGYDSLAINKLLTSRGEDRQDPRPA